MYQSSVHGSPPNPVYEMFGSFGCSPLNCSQGTRTAQVQGAGTCKSNCLIPLLEMCSNGNALENVELSLSLHTSSRSLKITYPFNVSMYKVSSIQLVSPNYHLHKNFVHLRRKKLYSSLWNSILTLFTKYLEHRIGKQKSRISDYKYVKS